MRKQAETFVDISVFVMAHRAQILWSVECFCKGGNPMSLLSTCLVHPSLTYFRSRVDSNITR